MRDGGIGHERADDLSPVTYRGLLVLIIFPLGRSYVKKPNAPTTPAAA